MKPGTAIEHLVKPIGRTLNLPCYNDQGQLKPESGCAKRRDAINNFTDAVYEHFFPYNKNNPEGTNKMQFAVNLSVIVEAKTPEQALELARGGNGETVNFSVNPRPVQPMRPNPIPQHPGLPRVG